MRGKRAVIYVRVSTSEQDTGLQETELRQYVESRGWECVLYQDKAQSGRMIDRRSTASIKPATHPFA
jgi:DNA invertase Pin-like site-specific DNA recombinase